MQLFLIRHGDAEPSGKVGRDEERALTVEGRRQAARVAAKLKECGVSFDLLHASPLKRALETAAILVEGGVAEKVEESHLLLPSTEPVTLAAFLSQLPELPPVRGLVGHEPLFSATIEILVFGTPRGGIALKKAGMAILERESGKHWCLVGLLAPAWL